MNKMAMIFGEKNEKERVFMDLKEFGKLREKVKKGQDIQRTIKSLQENIESISEISSICFYKQGGGYSVFDTSVGNLTDQMKQAYIDAAQEEIKLLEQEFAEL